MAEPDVLTVTVAWRDLLVHEVGNTPDAWKEHAKDYLETRGLRVRDPRYLMTWWIDLDRDCVVYHQVLRAEETSSL
jgi:hypothetical protein